MKRLLAALLIAAIASPAAALMAPQYYQQARDEASDVLVIEMLSVVPPPGLTGPCQVKGRVFNIERGAPKRYEVGQTVTFGVMCRKGNAKIQAGGVMWTDRKALQDAKAARVFLTPAGDVALYQFDILPELPPEMDEE